MTPTPEPARGLQAERTTLAWVRTALVCAALTSVAVHLAGGTGERLVAAAAGLAVAVVGMSAAWLRMGGLHGGAGAGPPPPIPPAAPALLAGAVTAADVLALALLLA